MNTEELIQDIVDLEWKMFQCVNNEGGRASCQDDWDTFKIMRTSQFRIFPEKILTGYHRGLLRAQMQERNLITEKYARMMASTSPERYILIEPYLPIISAEHRKLVEEVITIHKKWIAEHALRYPNLASRGRVPYTENDTEWDTSSETYLRGELLTWPIDALKDYLEFTVTCSAAGRNLVIEQDEQMVKLYGYSNIDEAESML